MAVRDVSYLMTRNVEQLAETSASAASLPTVADSPRRAAVAKVRRGEAGGAREPRYPAVARQEVPSRGQWDLPWRKEAMQPAFMRYKTPTEGHSRRGAASHQHALPFATRQRVPTYAGWAGPWVLLLSVFVGLGFAEVGLRVFYLRDLDTSTAIIHRASADPELVYELTPGSAVMRNGVRVQINSEGFRDDPFPNDREEGEFRIVVIGDSVAVGLGVPMAKAFPQALEQLLNEPPPFPNTKVTVLNMSVFGYSMRQELRVLTERCLPKEPDLIIWSYCLNDPDQQDAGQARYYRRPPLAVMQLLHDARDRFRLLGDDRKYHVRIHQDFAIQVEENFKKLGQISVQSRVRLLVAVIPAFHWGRGYPWFATHERIVRLARENGLESIDLLDPLMDKPVSKVGRDIWHPTVLGHSIIAGVLAEWVRTTLG